MPPSSDLRQRYDKTMLSVYAPPSPVFVRGQGATLWDESGREYIDFGGGIAVLSLGHAPPTIAKAIAEQAARLLHTSNLHVNDASIALAEKLTAATFAERVFLCNSGAEANEAAIKCARHRGIGIHPQKYRVLSFEGGFHGRLGFAMAATGQEKIRHGFGPLADGFDIAPFNDIDAAAQCMSENTCAILAEPVQGEGGVRPAKPGFLRDLRALADRHNALLLLDEIQTGAGRCGSLYAYMDEDMTPDILTTAKGLGGGFPVAAGLFGKTAAAVLPFGAHGTTFGGNPLAARAACAVLDVLLSAGFMETVRQRSDDFFHRLTKLNDAFNCFDDIRGRGLLIGCRVRASQSAAALSAAALENGLIVITAADNVLRFAPALNISDAETDSGFARLRQTLQAL